MCRGLCDMTCVPLWGEETDANSDFYISVAKYNTKTAWLIYTTVDWAEGHDFYNELSCLYVCFPYSVSLLGW